MKHKRFVGCHKITSSIELVTYDIPLAVATVIEDDKGGPLRLQLDYFGKDKNMIDDEGYIGIRWTKQDLQYMLSLLEISEEKLKK